MEEKTYFEKFLEVDVSPYVKEKNGLKYLPWAVAYKLAKLADERFEEQVVRFPRYIVAGNTVQQVGTAPYEEIDFGHGGYLVTTEVTLFGDTKRETLPVLDAYNNPVRSASYSTGGYIVPAFNAMLLNSALKRCLVKNLAKFGLGLALWCCGDELSPVEATDKGSKKSDDFVPIIGDLDEPELTAPTADPVVSETEVTEQTITPEADAAAPPETVVSADPTEPVPQFDQPAATEEVPVENPENAPEPVQEPILAPAEKQEVVPPAANEEPSAAPKRGRPASKSLVVDLLPQDKQVLAGFLNTQIIDPRFKGVTVKEMLFSKKYTPKQWETVMKLVYELNANEDSADFSVANFLVYLHENKFVHL